MRQAKAVPHLMLDDRNVGVSPGWFPGRAPDLGHTVDGSIPAAAHRHPMQPVKVEHQIQAAVPEKRKIHAGIRRADAIFR